MKWIYDGSFDGLLTAVFEWYERKPGKITLEQQAMFNLNAFEEVFIVHTSTEKSDRVRKAYIKRLDADWNRKIYCAWLSESPTGRHHIFQFLLSLFSTDEKIYHNYGNEDVVTIAKLAGSVEREKHRMEAFIRFEKMQDGLFSARVNPDFNVLPLISKHFKDRYSDQSWLIYDLKRNYGLHYDLHEVEIVSMEKEVIKIAKAPEHLDKTELKFRDLWKNYFNATNIAERKNTKLHIQHVPRRYHKYLTELS